MILRRFSFFSYLQFGFHISSIYTKKIWKLNFKKIEKYSSVLKTSSMKNVLELFWKIWIRIKKYQNKYKTKLENYRKNHWLEIFSEFQFFLQFAFSDCFYTYEREKIYICIEIYLENYFLVCQFYDIFYKTEAYAAVICIQIYCWNLIIYIVGWSSTVLF